MYQNSNSWTVGCVLTTVVIKYIILAHPEQKKFGLRWWGSKYIFNENQAGYGLQSMLSKGVLCLPLEGSVFCR